MGIPVSQSKIIKISKVFSIKLKEIQRTLHGLPSAPTSCDTDNEYRGLVLGVYSEKIERDECEPGPEAMARLTPTAMKFNDLVNGMMCKLLKRGGSLPAFGKSRVFYDLHNQFQSVVLVGLGSDCASYDCNEELDVRKEIIRSAAALGARILQSLGAERIFVESFGCAEAAAEGASLGTWIFQEFKRMKDRVHIPYLNLYDDCDYPGWYLGLHKAEAQNLSRDLTEMPANILNPTSFAQKAVEVLCKSGINVEVKVTEWMESQGMRGILAAGKGSCHQPIFLELSYYGGKYDDRPIVLVGCGTTFDSGGLCLQTPYHMRIMRGDMTGAACVIAAMRAIANMKLPVNIRGLIPLCENMPGCSAVKPGDIVKVMNGKSVRIENTDAESQLMAADALCYAQNFWPKFIVDIGSFTHDAKRSTGAAAAPVFTNSDCLWDRLRNAGAHTGDRVWRHPLWHYYTRQVVESASVDMKNTGRGHGNLCKVAAFLREFVPCGEWIHIDTFGICKTNGVDFLYLRKGMSGRPTRTVIEFIAELSLCKCP